MNRPLLGQRSKLGLGLGERVAGVSYAPVSSGVDYFLFRVQKHREIKRHLLSITNTRLTRYKV